MADDKKIQTRFPELHAANGVSAEQMEVLPPEEKKDGQAAAADGQQQQQQNDQQQQQQDNSGGNNNNGDQQQQAAAQQQQSEEKGFNLKDLEGMPEEQRNAILDKLTGGKFKSLEELNPPKQKSAEELAEEATTNRRNALAWGLENGRFKQEDYDNAVVLKSKSDRELALMAFGESVRAEEKDLTDAEVEELFKDAYHEGQKEDSMLFKTGQRNIKELAAAVRQNKTGILDSFEGEYNEVQQINQQFKGYKKQLKDVIAQQPKSFEFSFEHPNLDGTANTLKYTLNVDQKEIDKVVSEMSSEKYFSVRNLEANGKYDDKKLAEDFQYHLKARVFDTVMKQALADNTKDVEKRLLVQLGNKGHDGPQLNNGQAGKLGDGSKTNSYDGLHQFHGTGKYRSATGQQS